MAMVVHEISLTQSVTLLSILPFLVATSLITPLFPFRKFLFYIPTLILTLYIIYATQVDDFMLAHSIGDAALSYLIASTSYLLITPNIARDFRRIGQKTPALSWSLFERYKWVFLLLLSPRGVGWTHCRPLHLNDGILKNHQPVANTTKEKDQRNRNRWKFVARRTVDAFLAFILVDIGSYLLFWLQQHWTEQSGAEYTWQHKLLVRFAYFGLPVWVYSRLEGGMSVMSAFAVAAGISQAEDWPRAFGSVFDAYTVRRFWGRTWHQCLRHPASTVGKWVARNVFCLRKGVLGTLVIVYTGFIITAAMHIAGDYLFLKEFRLQGMSGSFFLTQPLAIIFESVVIHFGQCLGLGSSKFGGGVWKMVGYGWVITWFLWGLPAMMRLALESRGLDNVLDSTLFIRHVLPSAA